ncbi:hypothetical protein NQ176_g8305 [Zarea fungicola]|uniref:Uncharacterized protein n=1 Tax=Zarea fungicola TaxID=93591 RepID=A0ACC1MU37_9HYPO|nr:hypothetical protein NQ176_g8305 [Lecanicillium fungicola]
MEHINNLLVERAERAAERIVFLQKRVAHLEKELDENDDELQHLRICLKAVEIQMPPNPDHELQRCINVFKNDFRALKHKRATRGIGVTPGGGGSPNAASPGGLMSPVRTPSAGIVASSAPTTPSPVGAKQRPLSYRLYT